MRQRLWSSLWLVLMILGTSLNAAIGASPTSPVFRQDSTTVDLFKAKDAGQIDVKLFPQNSKSGTVVITNNTHGPLTIKLPEAFAGIPILAQRRGGGGGGGEGSQGLGGGFGGGGGGGFGGGGGGVFNIGPEKVTKLKVVAVCLEHGKQEPSSRVPYVLVPIESLTSDAQTIEVVKMLGRGDIDQPAAQAAAWHLANGLSWEQLSNKIGVKHLSGVSETYFSSSELERGYQVAVEANRRAADYQRKIRSPGETLLSGSN